MKLTGSRLLLLIVSLQVSCCLCHTPEDFFFDGELTQTGRRLPRSITKTLEGSGDSGELVDDEEQDGPEINLTVPHLLVKVCGVQYYCQKGVQGPCDTNEILEIAENQSNSLKLEIPCISNLHRQPLKGCYHGRKIGEEIIKSTMNGSCVLRFENKPCRGYPSSYRFNSETRKCEPFSDSGKALWNPCGEDQILENIYHNEKQCRCIQQQQLRHQRTNQCYRPYTQGPCSRGQWLEPSSGSELKCRTSPCESELVDGFHYYWPGSFFYRSGCYQANTQGPCKHGKELIMDNQFRVTCRTSMKEL